MKLTPNLVAVAAELLTAPEKRHWGYDLSKSTGIRSGVLYPLLGRLYDEGWLDDGWEDPVEITTKRPPRRYYTISQYGLEQLGAVAAKAAHDRRFVAVQLRPVAL
ncbi:PadR family transcriptional regulator [Amnibacterium flavum]|uniref:PadR family transcriptional regulator n=1 Tax=Amnibacterium flavum TaxID=2173173 RepID=A0A2V1HL49_9MICO|nr:helix-turn-helix transcriptional regulator [Amnibacterium flavum]PVZ93298.1 PadR family transcriptional regulator [Amnibacterium flavum]